jgi:hypothetical protein
MTFFSELGGQRLVACKLQVPQRGAWFAVCDFEGAPDVAGSQTLTIGQMSLVGTIVSEYAGAFGEQRRCLFVGGAGQWGTFPPARAYHNDAGVKALLIAQDVAREVGETLGTFEPELERVGVDYVRDAGQLASRVLEDVIGDRLWWVGFDGVTVVGERPTPAPLVAESYRVLSYDPRARVAQLSLNDPSLLSIGHVLAGPALPEPQTVHEYTVQVDAAGVRVSAWCGGGSRSAGRLAELFARVAARVTDAPLLGLYRYRVVRMAGDGRASLQSVRRAAGLPDIEPISQWPGVAGAHAELTPGAEVLVAFVEGDRAQPVVTHYAGKDGAGFVPVSLTLGGSSGSPAARQNDTVEVLLPPAIFTGTIGGVPATGVITFPLTTTLGQITTGSSKVRVAT